MTERRPAPPCGGTMMTSFGTRRCAAAAMSARGGNALSVSGLAVT